MNDYSKLNHYVANGDMAAAGQLFHNMITNTARKIYEAMEVESDLEDIDFVGGDAADDLIADVSTDEDEQEMQNMEEDASATSKTEKSKPYKSEVVPNTAKLTPAPQPTNKQADKVNNLTPFPKTT